MLFSLLATGASAVGSLLGASQREDIAALNYQITEQNAGIQRDNTLAALGIESLQNRATLDSARLNHLLSMSEVSMRQRNAQRLRDFAESRSEQGREAVRRQIKSFDRFKSSQKAVIAASGAEFSGSPMDVMTDTAAEMQLALQDMVDRNSFERDEIINQAENEEFGASQQRLTSRFSLAGSRSAFRINQSANRLGKISAEMNYNATLFGAAMEQANQESTAFGERLGALGTVFAGGASIARNSYREPIR